MESKDKMAAVKERVAMERGGGVTPATHDHWEHIAFQEDLEEMLEQFSGREISLTEFLEGLPSKLVAGAFGLSGGGLRRRMVIGWDRTKKGNILLQFDDGSQFLVSAKKVASEKRRRIRRIP